MAYSVLRLSSSGGDHVLYDSSKRIAILSGTQDEMFDWKDKFETAEQQKDNADYMAELKDERMALLISAGHTAESAETFLRKEMPYLFT